ncbi:uncharacterized protein Z520_01192 [Fonsecaea multimorphosa CBS 102226]|uniref:DUF7908 domain-containing protein n=1 Tax=Fonsecaea multimorphosa CBS 102226 TaxID=1442371 RepID=A0A0D2J030_9EURO|nr:uncharacterized protein Z520_01192 [Fonsecaea multimorphosa CBS 102226]KIY02727.1 hypothetical protein Z520_01192 [Fonsecaea multimorphosa CBS 102226]OAL31588.1 hypothetical protein AYO22_01180 [Fonsecaea multimorphosa]
MNWRVLSGIALTWRLFSPVSCFGTTISIEISYCPATYTSSSTSSGASTSPTITPGEPVYLTFSLDGSTEFLSDDGTVTNDIQQAATFAISSAGQLMSGSDYVSTPGDVSSQPFAASPDTPLMKRLPQIFTLWSVNENDNLVWTNDAFVGGQAIFCFSGSTLNIVFDGEPPQDCPVVQITVIPAGSSNPSSTSSTTNLAQTSTMSTSAVTTSMESPLTTSASTSGSVISMSTTASGSDSSVSTSGASMSSSSPTDVTSSTSGPESSSSPATFSTTTSAYPAPTTTGTPNCYDRSPFDGTVNNNYLILCDTDLPGFDLEVVPASDIADCIAACNSYPPGSQGPCVAVEFDILANTDPCHLKFNISTVSRGADSFAQAAILVNQPYSPSVVFNDTGISSSETSATESSTVVSATSTTTSDINTLTSSSPVPSTSQSTSISVPSTSSMQQLPPTTTSDITQSTTSSTVAETTSQASPSSSSASSSGPNTASTSQQQSSTMTTPSSSFESSSSSNPLSSSPGSSSPTSSSTSISTTLISTSHPGSSGAATTSQFSSQSSPSPTSTSLATSSPRTSASTTVALLSTTAASYCSATPTTTNLCSTYNHQALNVNSDGYCYEVECATGLQGTVLNGNSTTATSLKNCVSYCTEYNVAQPFGCVGVGYLGSSSGSSPNCLLLSSITGTVSNANVDSARLLYAGYPSITDPIFTTTTTTTQTPVSSPTLSSLATSSSISTSTTSSIPTSCGVAPTGSASACPGSSPACYSYNFLGNMANFEIECATSFTGSVAQPLLAFDLPDCINQCQYANALLANSCLGVTFIVSDVSQGSTNNCYPYSTLTCATRGNATTNSARMLYPGYPQMTDYNDPTFLCNGSTATTATSSTTALVSSATLASSSSAPASPTTTTTTTTTYVAQTSSTVSTSSTTDLSQATSTNFPLAYPQDPICNNNLMSTYEGGQLSVNPAQGRLYDIECASDYTNAGNNPFGATTQPTYDSCANQCDIAAGQGTACYAFSWTASSGLCTLFGRVSNGVQLTTNMTNTAGIHSGRWLSTTVGSTTSSQPLQLYLARPIPFPVGPLAANSQTTRNYPGGTNTYFDGWSDASHATVLDLSSQYPGIQWKIFDQVETTLWVTANFWFTNTPLAVTAATQAQYSVNSRNNDTSPLLFPAANLPGYTLAPFWSYGHILGASQQGIYYQVDLISPGRYGISIEWFFSHYGEDNNVFHAVMTYDTGSPGVWSTYFFVAGASSGQYVDQGLRQTVGGQGNPDSLSQYFTYCAGQQNCVTPGAKMTMDTTQLDMSQVMNYTAGLFNPGSYAVGTWTWATKPCC